MTQFESLVFSLKATPFQETDQVVSFYSADYGELRAIAKGVKKTTSKLSGACEPLTLNHVTFARGKSLHTVCHYQRVASFPQLRQDLERIAAASVCTEVIRLIGRAHDEDSTEVYHLLSSTLAALDNPKQPWVPVSLQFHTNMLCLAGYLPCWTHCLGCDTALDFAAANHYPFYVALGGFLCPTCARQSQTLKGVNVSATTIQLLAAPEETAFWQNNLKAHQFLAYYWEHRLDCPVRSFAFLFQLLS